MKSSNFVSRLPAISAVLRIVGSSLRRTSIVFMPGAASYFVAPEGVAPSSSVGFLVSGSPRTISVASHGDVVKGPWAVFTNGVAGVAPVTEDFNSGGVWIVPAGVVVVAWSLFGPPGAGGTGDAAIGGGGGGGGEFRSGNLVVVPGVSINYQTGASGPSWFVDALTFLANTGTVGVAGALGGAGGAGGTGGVGGTVNFDGGIGGAGFALGGGGGGGGCGGPGGSGAAGSAGTLGAGGAGGAGGGAPAGAGGNGGNPNVGGVQGTDPGGGSGGGGINGVGAVPNFGRVRLVYTPGVSFPISFLECLE